MARRRSAMRMTHAQRLERRARIADDVRRGMSVSQAARTHKVSLTTAETACAEHELTITRQPPLRRGDASVNRKRPERRVVALSILRMLLDTKSSRGQLVAIAREMNATSEYVRQVRNSARRLKLLD